MVLVYLPPIVKYRWFSKILYYSTINLVLFLKNESENSTDFLVGVGHNKDSKGNPTSTRKKVKLITVINSRWNVWMRHDSYIRSLKGQTSFFVSGVNLFNGVDISSSPQVQAKVVLHTGFDNGLKQNSIP